MIKDYKNEAAKIIRSQLFHDETVQFEDNEYIISHALFTDINNFKQTCELLNGKVAELTTHHQFVAVESEFSELLVDEGAYIGVKRLNGKWVHLSDSSKVLFTRFEPGKSTEGEGLDCVTLGQVFFFPRVCQADQLDRYICQIPL